MAKQAAMEVAILNFTWKQRLASVFAGMKWPAYRCVQTFITILTDVVHRIRTRQPDVLNEANMTNKIILSFKWIINLIQ